MAPLAAVDGGIAGRLRRIVGLGVTPWGARASGRILVTEWVVRVMGNEKDDVRATWSLE